jgi:hypothetical protein
MLRGQFGLENDMTEPLRIELKPVETSKANVESLEEQASAYERLLRVFAREVGRLATALASSAEEFASAWQRCVRLVAAGETERVQATREWLSAGVQDRLDLLKRVHRLAVLGRQHAHNGALDPEVLAQAIAGLERLKEQVLDRWQTTEDLEDLAARDYPLTTADLERIGPGRQPPASWYAEESQPF